MIDDEFPSPDVRPSESKLYKIPYDPIAASEKINAVIKLWAALPGVLVSLASIAVIT